MDCARRTDCQGHRGAFPLAVYQPARRIRSGCLRACLSRLCRTRHADGCGRVGGNVQNGGTKRRKKPTEKPSIENGADRVYANRIYRQRGVIIARLSDVPYPEKQDACRVFLFSPCRGFFLWDCGVSGVLSRTEGDASDGNFSRRRRSRKSRTRYGGFVSFQKRHVAGGTGAFYRRHTH